MIDDIAACLPMIDSLGAAFATGAAVATGVAAATGVGL